MLRSKYNSPLVAGMLLMPCLIFGASYAYAEQGSLSKCQQIKDKIDYYTNLKRAGGTAKQMTRWHNKRNDYKAKYSSSKCSKHRKDLD